MVFITDTVQYPMLTPPPVGPSEAFRVLPAAMDPRGMASGLYPFHRFLTTLCFGGGEIPKGQGVLFPFYPVPSLCSSSELFTCWVNLPAI